MPYSQRAYPVRFDWGPAGAAATAPGAAYAVVVDVLSFTTTLSVAMDLSATVYPYGWRDASAREYAAARDATLAVGRFEALEDPRPDSVSLSPASLSAAAGVSRLVLPSPNGSTICVGLAGAGVTVVGASLRNRAAVSGWLQPRLRGGAVVSVTAAGERWAPEDSLRPAVEDLIGAGAVIAALDVPRAWLSPEAAAALAAYTAVEDLAATLRACSSGRELIGKGFGDDVEVAADLDASRWVPVLDGEAFVRV